MLHRVVSLLEILLILLLLIFDRRIICRISANVSVSEATIGSSKVTRGGGACGPVAALVSLSAGCGLLPITKSLSAYR